MVKKFAEFLNEWTSSRTDDESTDALFPEFEGKPKEDIKNPDDEEINEIVESILGNIDSIKLYFINEEDEKNEKFDRITRQLIEIALKTFVKYKDSEFYNDAIYVSKAGKYYTEFGITLGVFGAVDVIDDIVIEWKGEEISSYIDHLTVGYSTIGDEPLVSIKMEWFWPEEYGELENQWMDVELRDIENLGEIEDYIKWFRKHELGESGESKDVNSMNYDELYDYLDKRYDYVKYNNAYARKHGNYNFVIKLDKQKDGSDGILIHPAKVIYTVALVDNGSEKMVLIPEEDVDSRRALKKLGEISEYEDYTLPIPDPDEVVGDTYEMVKFKPKDGEVTNQFFVQFIDFILDNTDESECYIKRAEEE